MLDLEVALRIWDAPNLTVLLPIKESCRCCFTARSESATTLENTRSLWHTATRYPHRALQTRSTKCKQQPPFWSAAAPAERPGSRSPQSSQDSRSAQSTNPQPNPKRLVVVEGPNDRLAVNRAVHAEASGSAWLQNLQTHSTCLSNLQRSPQVKLSNHSTAHRIAMAQMFILGGAAWLEAARSVSALSALQRRLDSFDAVYTLLDPDVAGRQGRNKLEEAFPGQLWHAFIPARLATARQATRHHEEGNIGVEHADAENIRCEGCCFLELLLQCPCSGYLAAHLNHMVEVSCRA